MYYQGLYRLSLLRKLTVSDNEITRLSNDIGQLIALQELDVSRNGRCLTVYFNAYSIFNKSFESFIGTGEW